MTGNVPLRNKLTVQHSDYPLDGSTDDFEWQGYIPAHELPHVLNPEQGYIISCNHKLVSDKYPHFLGNTFKHASRAIRVNQLITECIQQKGHVTTEDCKRMQLDVKDTTRDQIIKHLDCLDTIDLDKLHARATISPSSVPITRGTIDNNSW